MENTSIEKLSYTEVTKNISQAEYDQTQEEYILSKSPDKYMISLPVKVLMFEGAKDSSPFTYYFYMENDEDLYLMQRKRNGSVVDKTKIPLTKEQGQKILDGDYQFLLDSDEPLLNSLYFQFTVNQLHPLYKKECTRKIFHQNRFQEKPVLQSVQQADRAEVHFRRKSEASVHESELSVRRSRKFRCGYSFLGILCGPG